MGIYVLINLSTNKVESRTMWDGSVESGWSPPEGYIAIESEIAQIGWSYINGQFIEPEPDPEPQPSIEELAIAARQKRDNLLRTIYDIGIIMAQRALRMATTQEELSYAEGKIVELDNYAQALEDIPEQEGFPYTVDWPIAPTR